MRFGGGQAPDGKIRTAINHLGRDLPEVYPVLRGRESPRRRQDGRCSAWGRVGPHTVLRRAPAKPERGGVRKGWAPPVKGSSRDRQGVVKGSSAGLHEGGARRYTCRRKGDRAPIGERPRRRYADIYADIYTDMSESDAPRCRTVRPSRTPVFCPGRED